MALEATGSPPPNTRAFPTLSRAGAAPSRPENEHALGARGYAAIAVAVLILLVVGGFSAWLAVRNREGLETVSAAQRLQLAVSSLRTAIDDAETGQRGFLITGEREYLQPFLAARTNVPAELAVVQRGFDSGPTTRQLVRSVTEDLTEKLAELQKTVDFITAGDRAAAVAELLTDRGKTLMDRIRANTATLAQIQQTRLSREEARISDRGRWLVITDGLALLTIVLLAAWVAYGLRRHVLALRAARRELHEANALLANSNETLEQTVAIRTADLREANDEIQRFAYIVSHDLRAPLVNIMGFTSELEAATGQLGRFIDTVAERHPDTVPEEVTEAANDDLPEAIRFIKASTSKMDRLISAILRLSREGRRVLSPEKLDMTQVLGGIADTLHHQASEAGAEFAVDTLPGLTADRIAVEQIFSNLMENALKYLQPGRPGRIRITGTLLASTTCYAISDNGRGIAERDHERIFELFRRAGDQTVAGEGIGLAHVRALVRRLGGTIDCESTLGVGSTFRVRLPVVTAASRSAAA